MMSVLTRLKKSRGAHRRVLKGLILEAKDLISKDVPVEDVEARINLVKAKDTMIAGLNEQIMVVIPEEEIDQDVDECAAFELQTSKDLAALEKSLQYRKEKMEEGKMKKKTPVPDVNVPEFKDVKLSSSKGVKLSKIEIKKFSGDPVAWQEFKEIFEATIDKKTDLSDIEKFSYLRGHVTGDAERCIEGIPLTNKNYSEAWNLLQERFGNPQLICTTHMMRMLKIEKAAGKNVKELRRVYDEVESHVRALKTGGVLTENYGALIVPVILERLPDEIQLEISRKMGTACWKIEPFMNILKDEITARESCQFMLKQSRGDVKKGEGGRRNDHSTIDALVSSSRGPACAFCKKNHYSDKCNVVTDVKERTRIVKEKRLCFKCLAGTHVSRNCMSKKSCYRCKGGHHTALCEQENPAKSEKNPTAEKEDSEAHVSDSRTSVLLQTARGMISDTAEKKSVNVKILLDACSQCTYFTEKVVNQLNLQPIDSKKMTV